MKVLNQGKEEELETISEENELDLCMFGNVNIAFNNSSTKTNLNTLITKSSFIFHKENATNEPKCSRRADCSHIR